MTLRHKTLMAVGATLIGLLLLLYLVVARIWMTGFAHVENQQTRDNVQRVADALSERIAKINQVASDYAGWDATYRYIVNGDKSFEKINLTAESWDNLELNFVLFVRPTGHVLYDTGYDLKQHHSVPLSPQVRRAFLSVNLQRFANTGDSRSGILMLPASGTTPRRAILFASRPILTSARKGPIRGAVIFARYFDEREIAKLSSLTHLDLSLHNIDDSALPGDFVNARQKLLYPAKQSNATPRKVMLKRNGEFDAAQAIVRPLDEESIAGYAIAADVTGTPALMLRVDSPRTVHAQGRAAGRYFVASLLGAGIIFGAVPLLLLEKLVLRRLSRLSEEVEHVGAHPDPRARVTLEGRDELGALSGGINNMLGALEESQEKLRASEELYREMSHLALSASDAIFVAQMDVARPEDGVFEQSPLTWHGQVLSLLDVRLGSEPQTLEEWLQLLPAQERTAMRKSITVACANGEGFQRECRVRAGDGVYRHWMVRSKPLCDAQGYAVKFIGACTDITERRVLEERLSHQAFHDPLTNLSNRVLFMDRLEQAMARAERRHDAVAVLFVDLDNFKFINDSMGHGVGDALLIGVAQRLQSSLRAGDTACRFGGDEFTIILDQVGGSETAMHIAERIVQTLQAPLVLSGRDVFITASVGIALNEASDDADSLLRKADVAMYEAKKHGKDCFAVFRPGMSDAAQCRIEMESDLNRALEGSELVLHYQPIVNLRSGRASGFEALVRWRHPQRGLLSPVEFIPLAEETGQIVAIGQWTLETACAQLQEWQQGIASGLGIPLLLSLNLSARQLHHPTLVENIESALKKFRLPASSLLLEIAEGAVLESSGTLDILQALKALGVRLAIDDFGTGHSSLAYLKSFPLDSLKIDRKFVAGLGHHPYNGQTPAEALADVEKPGSDMAILSSVIGLARTLRLSVIAEGVENESEIARLSELGCDMAQGYYFSAPMAAPAVEIYLRSEMSRQPLQEHDALLAVNPLDERFEN